MKNYESCIENLIKEKDNALKIIEKSGRDKEEIKSASLDVLKNFEGAKNSIEELHEKGYEGWTDLEETGNHFNEPNDYFRMQFFYLSRYLDKMRIIPLEYETGLFIPDEEYIPYLTF